MLPPSYLDRMPDTFVQLWQQVEDEILQDVARRIGKMDAVTPTAIMAIVLNLILPQTPVVAQHIDAAKDAAVDLVLPESKK